MNERQNMYFLAEKNTTNIEFDEYKSEQIYKFHSYHTDTKHSCIEAFPYYNYPQVCTESTKKKKNFIRKILFCKHPKARHLYTFSKCVTSFIN